MTITTQTCDVTYTGNGATTVFAYGFEIPEAADAVVTVTTIASGVTSVLSPAVYSITGLGNAGGGTVTYPLTGTPLSSAFYITIARSLPVVQETDLVNQDGFYPAVVENALDYQTMVSQELKDENNRQLTFPITESGLTNRFLPAAGVRAGKYLMFDGSGNPTVGSGASDGSSGVTMTISSLGTDVDNSAAVQLAAEQVAALGGGRLLMLSGTYGWNGSVQIPSNVWVDGEGYGTCIYPMATMGLTVPAMRNVNQTPIAAYVRTDSRIRITNIRFDGSRRTYPEYLQDGAGAPVTNPAQDPTRNTSTYTTGGFMIYFSMAADVEVSDCFFENHGSFVVVITGCLEARVDRNGFFNCGRLGYSSNMIYIGHVGTFEQIVSVTKGADTVFNFIGTNASVGAGSAAYIWGCKGLSNLFPNGLVTKKSSTSTSFTVETDSSAATDFIFDGRALIGSELCTLSEHCQAIGNWGFSIKRGLIQVGGSSFVEVRGTRIRNSRETGVFLASSFDTSIFDTQVENVDMADIVSAAIEVNFAVNTLIDGLQTRNNETYAISVIGACGLTIRNCTLCYPYNNPSLVYPYGPFGEAADWTGTITTVSGNAAATISPSINLSPASSPNSRLTGKVISLNTPAAGGISWAADGATAVTLSPVADLTGTTPARINWYSAGVSTTPGQPIQIQKQYAIAIGSFGVTAGSYPVRDVLIENVKVQDEFGYCPGAVYFYRAGSAVGTVYNVRIKNLDTSLLGKRGAIVGITNAASAVITTAVPHGLAVNDTIYVRNGVAPGNGGPFTVSSVGSPTTVTVNWDTSALDPFVQTLNYMFGTTDPAADVYSNASALDLTRYWNEDLSPYVYAPGFTGADGLEFSMDMRTSRQVLKPSTNARLSHVSTSNNSTTINLVGAATGVSDGTATAIATTTTNVYTRTPRLRNVSAAGAGSSCGYRASDHKYTEDGGWVKIAFGWELFVAGAAAFVGLRASATAHGNVDPSTFTQCIGVGINAGDTAWKFYRNDGAGVCTETTLGSQFPANTSATDLYELLIFWIAGSTSFNVQLTNLTTGAVASRNFTTNIPAVGLPMNSQIIANNRAVASAIDLSFSEIRGGITL